MNRTGPSIERRTRISQVTVERTPHTGKRLAIIVLVLSTLAGIFYFSASRLPALINQFSPGTEIDSLIAKISAAANKPSATVPQGQGSELETLHAAIRAIDLPAVKASLKKLPRTELNQPLNGMTALMSAASAGNAKVVRALLAHDADPNARGAHQRTALQYAAEKDRRRAARLLLDGGADIDGADNGSLTPLIMAADRNYTKLASMLIQRGANVNIQNIEGWTALMDAAEAGNVRIVRELLAAGARTEARHRNGSSALDFAIRGDHQQVIQLLTARTSAPQPAIPAFIPQTTDPSPTARQSLPVKKGERQ